MGSLCWKSEDANDVRSPQVKANANAQKEEEKDGSRIKEDEKALVELKIQKRSCDDYLTKMEVKISESKTAALKYSKAKEKSKAIFAMKLKKMYEATKGKIEGQRHIIETSIINLEQARMDADVFEVLKKGDQVLTEIRSKVSVEAFEEIYDNMQERQQLTEYLGQQAGDESEVSQELDQLEAQLAKIGEPNTDSKVNERLAREDVQAPTHEIKVEAKADIPAEQADTAQQPLLA